MRKIRESEEVDIRVKNNERGKTLREKGEMKRRREIKEKKEQ